MQQVYCSKQHANNPGNRFCTQCGEPLPLPQGEVLENRYRIVRPLGQGGFGRTYLAEDLQQSQQVFALKEFAPQVEKQEDLNKAKELFEREASVLKKLQHPQIPRFHTSLQPKLANKDFFFLVQEYVEGECYHDLLEKRIQKGQHFNEEEITKLLQQILPVLSYIHSQDVVHRDISPDNLILRSSDNLPVLIDFGGVKQLPASKGFWFTQLAANRTLLGKKGYAPEEQLRQGQAFPSSDLYSLAVTALVLLTGKEPQELYDSYQGTWRWGKEIKVSQSLEAVLKKMLAYKPSDRYPNADQVLKDLQSPAPLRTVNPMITKIKTMVASPGGKVSTSPNSNTPNNRGSRTIAISQNLELPAWVRPFGTTLIGTTVVGLVFVGTWAGVTAIIRGVSSIQAPKVSLPSLPGGSNSPNRPSNNPSNNPSNSQGGSRGEQVLARRQQLGISDSFFNKTVNDIFYTSKPELNGRSLSSSQEDADLRKEWVGVGEDLLNKIEQANLSTAARGKLGTYSGENYQRWRKLFQSGQLGDYTLDQLNRDTNQKFDQLFPGQRRGKLNQQTLGQIWYALAGDQINKIQSSR
jgi:serine/threonine protein kinase